MSLHLGLQLSWRERHGPEGRQRSFAVTAAVQEHLQTLLQCGVASPYTNCSSNSSRTRGVDELGVQVEGAGRGPAGLEASLEDLTQLWGGVLEEEEEEILFLSPQ